MGLMPINHQQPRCQADYWEGTGSLWQGPGRKKEKERETWTEKGREGRRERLADTVDTLSLC